jgi:hypothetical protein
MRAIGFHFIIALAARRSRGISCSAPAFLRLLLFLRITVYSFRDQPDNQTFQPKRMPRVLTGRPAHSPRSRRDQGHAAASRAREGPGSVRAALSIAILASLRARDRGHTRAVPQAPAHRRRRGALIPPRIEEHCNTNDSCQNNICPHADFLMIFLPLSGTMIKN